MFLRLLLLVFKENLKQNFIIYLSIANIRNLF